MISAVMAALIAAAVLTGCMTGEQLEIKRISSVLSVNCSGARLENKYDSHGGFLGDGTSFYQFRFDDGSPVNSIKNSGRWKPFPLSDNMTEIIRGKACEDGTCNPPLIIKEGSFDTPVFPEVAQGYWFFLDRHSDAADPKDDTHVFDETRYSYNFTVAVYDTDTNRLYYAEFDT